MIYLDNAATTLPKPAEVVQAVAQAMNSCGNSGRGTHGSTLAAARQVYQVRRQLGELFHCRADHVCFTPNSTLALNIALFGMLEPGDHVIATDWEHNSVLRPLYALEKRGVAVDFLPADSRGRLDYAALEKLVRSNTRLMVCTHASNVTGDMMDLAQVGTFVRRHGLRWILDASQTAGVFPIDMEALGTDVVCFTGHKSLMGPQGTGGLCIREGVEIRPLAMGGTGVHSFSPTQPEAYPTRLEAGTLNAHGLAGLGAAVEFICRTGMENIRRHENDLARQFYQAVSALPDVRVYGDFSAPERAAIVALNIGRMDAGEAADQLERRFGVATRPGAHCAPRIHRALGTQEQGIVRFSWSWFNTSQETDAAAEAVAVLAREAAHG